jgi:CBS domain-containing protein
MKYSAFVKDVMRKDIKTVSPEDSIQKAAEIMRKNKVGSVLVLGDKQVKGILTGSDIVYKHVATGKGEKVSDIMTRKLITITPDKTIEEAARIMVKNGIEKLPVFKLGKLIGLLSANDILRVQPALFHILLERLKMGGTFREPGVGTGECEVCGNFSDELRERRGIWVCSDCFEEG